MKLTKTVRKIRSPTKNKRWKATNTAHKNGAAVVNTTDSRRQR